MSIVTVLKLARAKQARAVSWGVELIYDFSSRLSLTLGGTKRFSMGIAKGGMVDASERTRVGAKSRAPATSRRIFSQIESGMARKTRTTSGSNCLSDSRAISARAADRGNARRYGRSEVIASS